jgi:hypothetical protein
MSYSLSLIALHINDRLMDIGIYFPAPAYNFDRKPAGW